MKKDILQKGIVLPLIIGVVLAVAFFAFLRSTDMFDFVNHNTVIAYHDTVVESPQLAQHDHISDYCTNDYIGTITANGESAMVKYHADYSNTTGSFSLVDGAGFGNGINYLLANYDVAQMLEQDGKFTYSGSFGDHSYKLADTKEYSSEHALLADNHNIGNGVVVYYQLRSGNGLSSDYRALLFEEVR